MKPVEGGWPPSGGLSLPCLLPRCTQSDQVEKACQFSQEVVKIANTTLVDPDRPEMGTVHIRVGFHTGSAQALCSWPSCFSCPRILPCEGSSASRKSRLFRPACAAESQLSMVSRPNEASTERLGTFGAGAAPGLALFHPLACKFFSESTFLRQKLWPLAGRCDPPELGSLPASPHRPHSPAPSKPCNSPPRPPQSVYQTPVFLLPAQHAGLGLWVPSTQPPMDMYPTLGA